MWFGELSTENCAGCILAHSLSVENHRIAKGTVLDESLIAELASAGYRELTVARIDADDVDENSAAQSLACLLYTSPSPRDATLSRMPSSA